MARAQSDKKKQKLWTKDYFLLWQGQLVSVFGDFVYEIALGFLVLALTGSPAMMTTLMAVAAISRLVLLPAGGVIADQISRKKLVILTDVLRGATVLIIAGLAYTDALTIPSLMAAAVIIGVCSSFFSPALMATIPELVGKKNLVKGNSYLTLGRRVTMIMGKAAGGGIFAVAGAPLLFLIDGLSYLFSAGSEAFIRFPEQTKQAKEKFGKEVKKGFTYIKQNPGLKRLLTLATLNNLFAIGAAALFIPLFEQEFSAKAYGIFMAIMGAGSLAGFLITPEINKRYTKRLFIASALTFPLFFIVITVTQTLLWMDILIFFAGFFNGVINVFFMPAIQAATPEKFRGKVMSVAEMFILGGMPLGLLISGAIAELLSVRLAMTLLYSCALIATIVIAPSRSLLETVDFKR
ncbi:MAG: MFS transporter [Candidatus Woesearchaeota archaeon]